MRTAAAVRRATLLGALCLALAVPACQGPLDLDGIGCDAVPVQATAAYVLPFAVGESALVSQGNCGPDTHKGRIRHAYDFAFEIGRIVTAAREGVVVRAIERFPDGTNNVAETNLVEVRHADGTMAGYLHLERDGALVQVGEVVRVGQVLGRSGRSGFTGPDPHLHFHVWGCPSGCDTIPVNFRNATPRADYGLQAGTTYTAGPFE